MKFEFVQETDEVLGDTVYFTRQEGIFITGSLSANKQKAYDLFNLLSSNIDRTTTTILETKNYQKPSQEE
jgi:hypothetical protein